MVVTEVRGRSHTSDPLTRPSRHRAFDSASLNHRRVLRFDQGFEPVRILTVSQPFELRDFIECDFRFELWFDNEGLLKCDEKLPGKSGNNSELCHLHLGKRSHPTWKTPIPRQDWRHPTIPWLSRYQIVRANEPNRGSFQLLWLGSACSVRTAQTRHSLAYVPSSPFVRTVGSRNSSSFRIVLSFGSKIVVHQSKREDVRSSGLLE